LNLNNTDTGLLKIEESSVEGEGDGDNDKTPKDQQITGSEVNDKVSAFDQQHAE
jgi:hypothetical protein